MSVDPLRTLAGYALRRASAVSQAGLSDRLEGLGLKVAEASLLVVVDANKHMTPSEISRTLSIASANLTPLVARLEERALLEREPIDGRSYFISLTQTGRALAKKVKAEMQAHESELIKCIPASHRAIFLKALLVIWGDENGA